MIYTTEKTLVLDIYQTVMKTVFAKQYDNNTRYLIFDITERGQHINLKDMNVSVWFKARTVKGTHLIKECEILDDGYAKLELDKGILQDCGNTQCEIWIIDLDSDEPIEGLNFEGVITGNILSTMYFILNVRKSTYLDDDVEIEKSTLMDLVGHISAQAIAIDGFNETASASALEAKNSEVNAKESEINSNRDSLKSEGYAVGTQNNEDVDASSPYYQNNSKYYTEQSEQYKNTAHEYRDEAVYAYENIEEKIEDAIHRIKFSIDSNTGHLMYEVIDINNENNNENEGGN